MARFDFSKIERSELLGRRSSRDEDQPLPPSKRSKILPSVPNEIDSVDEVKPSPMEVMEVKDLNPEEFQTNQDFVKILQQALHELGYSKTRETLEQESQIQFQRKEVEDFCKEVLAGNWDLADKNLSLFNLEGESLLNARFAIYQQKYLELLEDGNLVEALQCLRNCLTPLNRDSKQLHKLSSFIMCKTEEDLHKRARWDGKNGKSRHLVLSNLGNYIPADVLLAGRSRLLKLVNQGIDSEIEKCLHHNTYEKVPPSLEPHSCPKTLLPKKIKFTLNNHTDEVWYIKFSPNGQYMASGSKDLTIIIWQVGEAEFKVFKQLQGHKASISYLSWSPDSSMLLSCGEENVVYLWDIQKGTCLLQMNHHIEQATSCAWFSDGKRFVTGGLDKFIYVMNVKGEILHSWKSARINDLVLTPDQTQLIAVCQEKKIRVFNMNNFHEIGDFVHNKEERFDQTVSMTSLSLSSDGRYLLISTHANEIYLWDLEKKERIKKLKGHSQSRYVLRACFGGANERFVISGSEDNHVYLWHRGGTLLDTLEGHTAIINCVAWHPTNIKMFASSSDDGTINIWTT